MDVWCCPRCNCTSFRSDGMEGRPPGVDARGFPMYFCRRCGTAFPGVAVEPEKPAGDRVRKADIDQDRIGISHEGEKS